VISKPKILFLSQTLPYPLDSGPRLRTFFVIKHLSVNFNIHLVTFIRSWEEMANLEPLSEHCQIHPVFFGRSFVRDVLMGLRSLFSGESFMIIRHNNHAMRQMVDRLISGESFDLIHVDQIKTAQYVEHIIDLPKLIDKHNVYAHVIKGIIDEKGPFLQQILARLEWRKLARYEGQICREFDHVVSVTDEDRRDLAQLAGKSDHFSVVPIATAPDSIPMIQRGLDAKHIISVGSMFYPPNVEGALWFAKQVFPKIKALRPDVKLFLIGSRPAGAIKRLSELDPSIVVPGYVENLAPYLEQSAVMIAPIHFGSGMRVKILDSLARGMPMVSTTFGCQGIHVTHNKNILLADQPDDFAKAVLQVIQDRDFADRLVTNGRNLVQTRYDWQVIYQAYDRIYSQLLNR